MRMSTSGQFVKDVCDRIEKLSREQLAWSVRQMALILPHGEQESFRRILTVAGKSPLAGIQMEELTLEDLKKKIPWAEEVLGAIDNDELVLWEDISKDWEEDNPFDEDNKFVYSDPDGVMERIREIARLVHGLVEAGEYEPAFKLGKSFLDIDITVMNRSDSDAFGEIVSLDGACKKLDLHSGELKQLALDTALCAYHCSQSPLEGIYDALISVPSLHPGMGDLIASSRGELENQPAFLDSWTDYLGKLNEDKSRSLYEEALSLFPDLEERVEKVRTYSEIHPEGYLDLMRDKEIPAQERFRIGLDGINRLELHRVIRADIALETAQLAFLTHQSALARELCWQEAFIASPTPTNCLRALVNSRDQRSRMEELRAAYNDDYVLEHRKSSSVEDVPELFFLMGYFDKVLPLIRLPRKQVYGVSTFARTGTALFLTLLYRGTEPTPSIRVMTNIACKGLNFNKKEYRRGLPRSKPVRTCEFSVVFGEWKKIIDTIPERLHTRGILNHLEKVVMEQVAAVCEKKSALPYEYEECADFLGAIGDVRESFGQPEKKQTLLASIAETYPDRKELLEQLRRVGWEE